MAVTNFEYQFWTVAQLQAVGLTADFATSFNYFVRDVARINGNAADIEDELAALTIVVEENVIDIDILQTQMGNVQVLAADNRDRLDIVEPIVTQNTDDILDNFNYLNGQLKPNDYEEITNYVVGEYSTESNSQYKCITNTTGAFNPLDWEQIGVSQNDLKTSAHIDDESAHGVTGDNVGNEDYCTEVLGGVVDLAALIADLTPIVTVDIGAAPVAYDETYTNSVTDLTNENKAKINEIVTKVNDLLAGQILAKQMNNV